MNMIPCAIYTRKSSEEGLEQNFNSLDAQREACEAYILSQKAEGWRALSDAYDDGGFTGGNMERPGLKQLMADILAKKIRIVVVYKVDRLTRSLADFAKMVELFDAHGVSFVSVTQQFNTTSSMGRLTLNVLLSFAQFEREVTGERIRDKIAASKAKGMWMGGMPPIGYNVEDKALVLDEASAVLVREIYQVYLALGNVRLLKEDLDRRGRLTPSRVSRRDNQSGGLPFTRGHLYRILSNPIYIGQVTHREQVYPGQHAAIIDQSLWQAVQEKLISNQQGHKGRHYATEAGLLAGLVFGEDGTPLISTHSKKRMEGADRKTIGGEVVDTVGKNTKVSISGELGKSDTSSESTASFVSTPTHTQYKRYRYYVSQRLIKGTREQSPQSLRIPAEELEQAVVGRLVEFLTDGLELLRLTDGHGLVDAIATHAVLDSAAKMGRLLEDTALPAYAATVIPLLNGLIERITVSAHQVEIKLSFGSLISQAGANYHASPKAWGSFDWSGLTHTICLPIELKRSGLALRLMIEPPQYKIKRSADPKLLRLLSKAHIWFDQLTSGKVTTMQQIADEEKLTGSYISRVMQLAFLAPDIVKAIMIGKQPERITVDYLMQQLPLPIDWKEQRKVLGFD